MEHVSRQSGEPMHYVAITEAIEGERPRFKFGASPDCTVHANLATDRKSDANKRVSQDAQGVSREHLPDFIVRLRPEGGDELRVA